MNQRHLTIAALVMSFAALVAALWVLLAGGESGRREGGGPRGTVARGSRSFEGGRALGPSEEVGARAVDAAGDRVLGRVVDPESGPLEHGTLSFECVANGRPIRGANVRIDEDGRFATLGCGGPVCAQLRHPDFVRSEPWVLEPGVDTELIVRPLGTFEGEVLDGDTPVAGARVTVVPAEEDPTALPPLVSRNAATDADGRFSLARVEVPQCDPCAEARGQCSLGESREAALYRGPMSLVVSAPGFRSHSELLDGLPEVPLRIELRRDEDPVVGRLLGADGQAFARAELIARSSQRPHESHRVALEGANFELGGLGEGPYELRAIQDGIELLSLAGIEAGAKLELQSTRDAAGVAIELRVEHEGQALAGARVDGGPLGRGASTDAAGGLRVEGVLPGTYRIRVWAEGIAPVSHSLEVGRGAGQQFDLSL